MIKKNDILEVDIIDVGCNLEGIAKHDGVVLFVPYAMLGERVKVQIINTKQKAYICKLIEIVKPSEYRVAPKCKYFTKCGGCQTQCIKYEEQLRLKTELVKRAMENIAKIDVCVSPCVSSENAYYYRNKLAFPINPKTRKVGMYRPNSHKIVDIETCEIQEPWARDLIKIINEFLDKYDVSIYDEETKKGIIKHIVARHYEDKYLFTVVVNANLLPFADELISLLKEKFEFFGLNININKTHSNVILTQEFVNIYGFSDINISEFDINYSISNASFFQVNNYIKQKIYGSVLEKIENQVVIDAYSGAGLLSAMIAKKAKRVYGIEIISDAVKSADMLAIKNNITNLINICGDTAIELPKLVKKIDTDFTLILDPPRKGCDKRVIETILKSKPNKILYISCNPSTLARDIFGLKECYDVCSVTPFDMFPQTCHVETLAVLELKK